MKTIAFVLCVATLLALGPAACSPESGEGAGDAGTTAASAEDATGSRPVANAAPAAEPPVVPFETKPRPQPEPAVTEPAPTAPDQPASSGEPLEYVLVKTTKGDIVFELNREKAPISVANFLAYADRGFYDRTIFHRVIRGFVVQGGGYTEQMEKKPTDAPIRNEWGNGLLNARGTLSMARTSSPHSATSQFYINLRDNTQLDKAGSGGVGYAVFGRVLAGMEVVDAIAAVTTGMKGRFRDVPIEPVFIESVTRMSPEDARGRAGG